MGIRAQRQAAGMKIKDVCAALGVSRTAVFNWEHGQMNPSAANLKRLSALFGCSIDDLLE